MYSCSGDETHRGLHTCQTWCLVPSIDLARGDALYSLCSNETGRMQVTLSFMPTSRWLCVHTPGSHQFATRPVHYLQFRGKHVDRRLVYSRSTSGLLSSVPSLRSLPQSQMMYDETILCYVAIQQLEGTRVLH